jgi:radical SAM superfamily enzyme YgiQ (UPF0313 family)
MNREDRCQVPTKDVAIAPPLPPTDLMYMAAMAEAAGAECRIIDYSLAGGTHEDLGRDLREFRPDYIFMSTTTPTLENDLAACRAAREALPGVVIAAKAAHFLRFGIKVLAAHPELDIAIRGEAEFAVGELVSGRPRAEVPGITWRSPEGPANTPDRQYEDDLDAIPFPARHLVDNSLYVRPDTGRPQAVVKVSRGCPFNCFFCLATPVSGRRVRRRSPANIIEEVRLCIERYGIRDFLFWSDIFNLDRAWVVALCEAIQASGLRFGWATNTRADTVDPAMARLMKKSGCHLVSIGIESGSQEVLDRMGKKTDIAMIREAVGTIHKAGLRTFAYYVIGLPWDTRATVEETVRFAIELDTDYANFFTATAFPGTRFFEYAMDEGLFDEVTTREDLFMDAYYQPTVRGHHLTKDEITALHEEAVRRFFFRPRYILKTALKIRSLTELRNYARAALGLLK